MAVPSLQLFFPAAFILLCLFIRGAYGGLGVNYGTLGNNLPSAAQVATFLNSTSKGPMSISKIKIFDADPSILLAFANTGIDIIIGVNNADLLEIGQRATTSAAAQWVESNVAAYLPATRIVGIAVGNEVLGTHDKSLIAHVVPAMRNIHFALASLNLSTSICISSPFYLGILRSSVPPSSATFKRPSMMYPVLSFLASTGSPFMANVYPFFAYTSDPNPFLLDYALFNTTAGYTDPQTNLHYTNMFDAQLDALYSAMASLGFSNISIMVTETGWPSSGDPNQVGVNMLNAQTYINNLIKHVSSSQGTPLRPHQAIDTYIFALFNENMKPGPTSERNYGLFKPDLMPVYSTALFDSTVPLHSSPPSGALLASRNVSSTSPPLVAESPTSSASQLLVVAPLWTFTCMYVATMIYTKQF
eukprot:c20582_g1_i1 orf=145-1395(-)